jgi:hypothetical protein
VKKEFDEKEKTLVAKVTTPGGCTDWGSYQRALGEIVEVRAGSRRALEAIEATMGDDNAG